MVISSLPAQLKPSSVVPLIRMGRKNDGGYVVGIADAQVTDVLVSLGINDDWSFEEEFKQRFKVSVKAYDGSVSVKVFLKNMVKSLTPWFPHNPVHFFRTALDFRKFFSGDSHHFAKFVGLDKENWVLMDEIFDAQTSDKIFLKIDIEGSEYRLLSSILKNQSRLTGLVVEFHDVDLHIQKIIDFIRDFRLPVIAVHPNNFAGISGPRGMPLVIEVTFGSKNVSSQITPGDVASLFQPNDPQAPDIKIEYV